MRCGRVWGFSVASEVENEINSDAESGPYSLASLAGKGTADFRRFGTWVSVEAVNGKFIPG